MASERKLREEADTRVVETVARLIHAGIAAAVTYAFAVWMGLGPDAAKEVTLVNGGLAFYTDDVAGRLVAALNALTRAVSPHHH